MRIYRLSGPLLLAILFSAVLFSQPKDVAIEDIVKNPPAFSSTAVEVEGIVTQYVPSTNTTTSYYKINGEFGGSVKVNTSSSAPQLFKRYRVNGTVYIDPLSKEAFISEKSRSSLEPATAAPETGGIDPLLILLIILFLLLAAIFVYTQIARRRQKDYEEIIYTLPVTETPEGAAQDRTQNRKEIPQREPEIPEAAAKPALQPKPHTVRYTPAAHTASHMEPVTGNGINAEKISENSLNVNFKASPSFEADFRTIKIVPPAPQTITFIPGRLEIISGDDKGKSFRIAGFPTPEGSVVSIGREVVTGERAYAHIQLNEKFRTVSRRQAELIYRDHKLFVKNLSETNLTQVDGMELQPGECAELKADAKIRTGELEFQYKI